MIDTVMFLDERGTDDDPFYYIGGVVARPQEVKALATWVRQFKAKVRPQHDADQWYVKGSGEWIAPGGVKHRDSKEEAFERWERFADELKTLTVPYSIHAAIVLRGKYRKRFDPPLDKKLERETIFRAALVPVLLSLMYRQPSGVELFVDHVENDQAAAVAWAFDSVNRSLEQVRAPFRIEAAHNIAKDDCSSDTAQLLQFVDMLAYALSRFVVPSGKLSSILADFEQWPYAVASGEAASLLGEDTSSAEVLMARYFRIVPVFHHIRWRLIKNQSSKRGLYGSVALLARKDHLNFAAVIDDAMWKMGNTMSEVWARSGVGINLDAYE